MFRNYRVLVFGDGEFHSPKLAQWLEEQGISFTLRQKKDSHFQASGEEDFSRIPWFQSNLSTIFKKVNNCTTTPYIFRSVKFIK
ncbi:transposase [Sivoneniella epilithica]